MKTFLAIVLLILFVAYVWFSVEFVHHLESCNQDKIKHTYESVDTNKIKELNAYYSVYYGCDTLWQRHIRNHINNTFVNTNDYKWHYEGKIDLDIVEFLYDIRSD